MTVRPVAALVLAAGGSTRLGRPKQLEQVRGVPLVLHALRAAAPADETLLLTGARAPEVEALAGGVPCLGVGDWERGLGHVLARGVRAVRTRCAAVVVLLGDQPGVRSSSTGLVIARWRDGGAAVVSASYAGRSGHPRLFDEALFDELCALDGDRGAHDLLRRHPVVSVEVDGSCLDVDDEESLERARVQEH